MKVNVVNEGVKYGIIGGLIYLLTTFGAWGLCSTSGFVSATGIINFIPYMIVILIVTGLSLRKQNDNVLTYKDALKFVFVAYVVIAVTEAIGTYILYNLVDPQLTPKVAEIGKEKALKMMEKFGSSEQSMADAAKKIDADSKETGFKKIFLGMGFSLIWYFCKSLLLALVIRKEEKFAD